MLPRAILSCLLLSIFATSGCLQDTGSATMDPPLDARSDLVHHWTGALLVGEPHSPQSNPPPIVDRPPRPDCTAENCERISFQWEGEGDLLVGIEWEAQDETYGMDNPPGDYLGSAPVGMDLLVRHESGRVIDGVESFHYAAVATIPDAPHGEYEVEVVARWGTSTYLGAVVQAAKPASPSDGTLILPDLVVLPPDHLTVTVPIAHELDPLLGRLTPGCGPDEVAEDQELRCLRFAGNIGNQGPGRFQADLFYEAARASFLGDGFWMQRIERAGNEPELVPLGRAEYHVVHGHFHLLDFVETKLYEYDEETGTRGAALGDGRKTGFCIIDGGLIDPLQPQAEPMYHGDGCCYIAGFCQLDMLNYPYFTMGMSPGWYDIYPWWRADQYLEITGIPDGTYELVSTINPLLQAKESNLENNEGSAVFRLTGNAVEILQLRTQADVGPHPDAAWDSTG